MNDLQMVGPVIQNDLFSTLIKFRGHRFVISSDIEKMYRQVLVHPIQRSIQRTLWRSDRNNPVDTFELNTITYGTAAASFLAIRCLHQLALDCCDSHPDLSAIIQNDFYVDDLLTSASTVEDAQRIVRKLSRILGEAQFPLRNWVSN